MTTIADAARKISTELELEPDAALTLATTYAIQLGVDTGTQEGGQAPHVEISDTDAATIVDVARSADSDY